ncbi:hypothetical protein OSSY52_18900 [Tepiditoga spiralis]|uniref:Uncharacterized protein n=1 Tax=Tepiditoga spiralis TaxID=2108365 RepID=A0A7G1GC48_9BACT|nr:hypothetical protein [Tepiditoga spiralis]BBE31749.1 hypothetical protein OSSY52_18900 [Tepiditoga spiralis]
MFIFKKNINPEKLFKYYKKLFPKLKSEMILKLVNKHIDLYGNEESKRNFEIFQNNKSKKEN